MQVATKFVQSIYSNTFISNSNFLIPAFPILYVFYPHRTIRPSRDFRQKLRGKTSVSPFPFFPSHESLFLSLSLYTSGRCASFLPTVGKLALTRTTKECNQWGTRFRRHLSWNFQWRCSLRRIENREIRKRSRNLRLRQWRQLHWSSRRWCFPLPPLLPIIFYLFHFSSIQ